MNARPQPIVLTLGDPAGIGPEIACLAWERLRRTGPAFFVVGDRQPLILAAEALGRTIPIRPIDAPAACAAEFSDALPLLERPAPQASILGEPNPENAPCVEAWIGEAVDLALHGGARAVVTNPIAKSVLHEAGFPFPGHTEFIAELVAKAPWPEPRGPVMMLVGGGLKVALATIHLPLAAAAAALTAELLVHTGRVVDRALKEDFGIARPRIAFTGLNPHAGESGDLGREEIEIVNPAAAALRSVHGIDVSDAIPGDTAFAPHLRARYDAVVAMYHDQGLIPVKTLDFDGGVNVTLGLPVVRTSPDHGTAFGVAGTGQARPDSLLAAIALADEISARRGALRR